ncbi:hypothetical protein AGMMS50276_04250 [Synergistales bacterium]|nr:hypothetical protein AGMMS50276_04250 [Synergistales bacterium]
MSFGRGGMYPGEATAWRCSVYVTELGVLLPNLPKFLEVFGVEKEMYVVGANHEFVYFLGRNRRYGC